MVSERSPPYWNREKCNGNMKIVEKSKKHNTSTKPYIEILLEDGRRDKMKQKING